MSETKAERAWERWAEEHRSDTILLRLHDAFLAGYAAGKAEGEHDWPGITAEQVEGMTDKGQLPA